MIEWLVGLGVTIRLICAEPGVEINLALPKPKSRSILLNQGTDSDSDM